MLTREDALQILEEKNTPANVIEHCEAVARKAVKIAEKLKASDNEVDINLVETGALLHDIGRSQTHGIDHGYVGGIILKGLGLEKHSKIAFCHIGAGLTKEEAKKNGLTPKNYLPTTIEEKIIANADNLVEGTHSIQIGEAIQKLRNDQVPEEAIERVRELYSEIEALASSL